MSKLGERRHRHDAFFLRAKRDGYAARSIYKLEEIDQRHHVLRVGASVLDLGCRPGSWMQYARKVIGPTAALVGIDRQPLEVTIPGARIIVGDIFDTKAADLLGDLVAFDVVLSDMAPDTSGIRTVDQARSETLFERALELALELSAPGGNFVGKLFMGPAFQELVTRCRTEFQRVALVKPAGTRKESIEQYVVALGRRRR
ncbi:MAG: RlmE family RNA methyltransferase [Myxococcales bacterium]|nr:RlmE family RNA methyltransferase [Myxococcales bacterium]